MARAAAEKLGVTYEITHVRDVDVLVQRGVPIPPALAIDGRVVVTGRIPGEEELASWLTSTCVDR